MPSDDDFDLGLSDEEPMTPPVIKPITTNQSTSQSTSQLNKSAINAKPPVNPPINQKPFNSVQSRPPASVSQPVNQSINQSMTQKLAKPTISIDQSMSGRMSMTQSNNQSINQSTNQSLDQSKPSSDAESDWDSDSDAEQSNKKPMNQSKPTKQSNSINQSKAPVSNSTNQSINPSNQSSLKASPTRSQPAESDDFDDFDIDDNQSINHQTTNQLPSKQSVTSHQSINHSPPAGSNHRQSQSINQSPVGSSKKQKPVWESDSEPDSPIPQSSINQTNSQSVNQSPVNQLTSQSNRVEKSTNQSINQSPMDFHETQPGSFQTNSQSINQSFNQSNYQSTNQSTNQYNEQVQYQLTNVSTNQPLNQSFNQPMNQSMNQSNYQPTNQVFNQSANQSSNRPINQLTNQPMDQSFNEPMNQSFNQPMNQSFNQPMNQSFNQPMNQSFNQPLNQSFNQSINQPINQPTNQSMIAPISPTTIAAQKRLAEQSALEHMIANEHRSQYEAALIEANQSINQEKLAREEFEKKRILRLAEETQRRHEIEMAHRQSINQSEAAFLTQQREIERSMREARLAREQSDRYHREEINQSRNEEKLRNHQIDLEKRERERAENRALIQAARLERFNQFESERSDRLLVYEQSRIARENAWKQEDDRRRDAQIQSIRHDEIERERARSLAMEQERARWENDQRALIQERDEEIARYRSLLSINQKENEERVIELTNDSERRLLQMHEGFELERMRWNQSAENDKFRDRQLIEHTYEKRTEEVDSQWRRQLHMIHETHKSHVTKLQVDLDQSLTVKNEQIRVLQDKIARMKREFENEEKMLHSQLNAARSDADAESVRWKTKLEERERMIEDMKLSVEEAYQQRIEFTKQLSSLADSHANVLQQRDISERERDELAAQRLTQKQHEIDVMVVCHQQQMTSSHACLLDVRAMLISSEDKLNQQSIQIEDARLKLICMQREHDASDQQQIIKFTQLKQGLQHVTDRLAEKQAEYDESVVEQSRLKSLISQRDAQLESQSADHARWSNDKHVDRSLLVQLQSELATERQHRQMMQDEIDRLSMIHSECNTRLAQHDHENEMKFMISTTREAQLKREIELKQERILTLTRDLDRLLMKQDQVNNLHQQDDLAYSDMKRELQTLRMIVSDLNHDMISSNIYEEKEQLETTTRINWPFESTVEVSQPADTIRRKLREIESRMRST